MYVWHNRVTKNESCLADRTLTVGKGKHFFLSLQYMLRKIRISLAVLMLTGITLLMVGIGNDWWGWMPRLQLLPSIFRIICSAAVGNIAVVAIILIATLLCGRLYCSVICPLGVMQDVVIWLRRRLARMMPRRKALRKYFKFSPERKFVRTLFLGLMIGAIVVDLQLVVSLLEPYSAYGRMITGIVGGGPLPLLVAAGVTCLIIVVCAWVWGRAWCNIICPAGTLLGYLSRFQLWGVKVDEDKCIRCGACNRGCKSSCIDKGTLSIDYSRCVDCFDCIDICSQGAISFGRISRSQAAAGEEATGTKKGDFGPTEAEKSVLGTKTDENGPGESESGVPDPSRRAFLATGTVLLGSAVAASAQNMKLDGGLAEVLPKQPLERKPRIVPPGAVNVRHFYDLCTACQLCVTSCPNGVLRTSTDLEHFLQPQMGYEKGFCRPECTECSQVCPTGAILPLQREAKTLVHIGTASIDDALCLAATGVEHCGKCARECPTGAIMMVDIASEERSEAQSADRGGAGGMHSAKTGRRPVVAEEICIGCGKCEYLCPVRPISAITVNGLETHIV